MAKKGPSALAPSPICFLIHNQNSSSLAPSPSKRVAEPPESPSLLPLRPPPGIRSQRRLNGKCSVNALLDPLAPTSGSP